ncbi:mitochondrial intermediate peptidase, mitochondrial isoform X2 [Nymphaea colorata]|uniref:mitochondrial intermediate peptidase, mitochondrial isoform X2 n=1 Tax=Nymphaea colorata TaxID=210225 RepID=UPI00129D7C08|nr:mitochondrial intermediate peptidase, mitochondrial isoform X2 [Nymphaea colorata]
MVGCRFTALSSRLWLIRRKALSRSYHFGRADSVSPSILTSPTAHQQAETGLYGFEQLKTPKGFRYLVKDAIKRSEELIAYISRLPPSEDVIRAMDEISDTVCSVVDSAELCRNTHPDSEFVKEADKASVEMNAFLHLLNTNQSLYDAVVKAETEGVLTTVEAQRAAHTLRTDFEKGGIHLCAGKLDRVDKINAEIARLGREFNENIVNDPGQFDVFPSSRVPKSLHHILQRIYCTKSGSVKLSVESSSMIKESGFRITTDEGTLSSILKWTNDAEVRKRAYITGHSAPFANLSVLDKLIAARHELAQDRADKEVEIIRKVKSQFCGDASGDVQPWDEAYFKGIIKSSAYEIDPTVVASYFPLSQCLEGLKVIVESLFGATFYNVSLAPGESWHPNVVKLLFHHPNEGDLGFLYLDLYSRKDKFPGCAHFAIKGGRKLSKTQYQLPVVALVCNFSARPGPSTSNLNHWEVETLFHEFGHALHSLLSRTDYQHFSGTRMVLDLAETPANLFEYFAWDYRVLKRFARHYSSGEIIPENLVASMNSAKNMFVATDLQRQIFYSAMDQKLFGEQSSTPTDTIDMVADLTRKYTSWGYVEGTHWHTRFNHLINYGAGYYSYLYAKCFAATIWQKVFNDEPLSLSAGSILRTKFLQYGGSRDPSEMLNDFLGNGIMRNTNGGSVPNVCSLRKELNM